MSVIRSKLRLKRPREVNTEEPPQKKVAGQALTKAEVAFKSHRDKMFDERVKNKISNTHRTKVESFNKLLSDLPEHYEIPRVGPG